METRARYTLVGAFTLAVILAVFAFVYWLDNTTTLTERHRYRVVFDNTVSGLLEGSSVYFNGIRVGEVTDLSFRPDDPSQIEAAIAIDPGTPIRQDTAVGVEFQGLTGLAAITLSGGSKDAPELVRNGDEPPILQAPLGVGETMTQAARNALQRVDKLVADNSESLTSTITDVKVFAEALARNAERVDNIMAGLERMTGGGAKAKLGTYDIAALTEIPQSISVPTKQLAISQPSALINLDTAKIIARKSARASGGLEDEAEWNDSLPRLFQARLIESFENVGYKDKVSRPLGELVPDCTMEIDIRHFELVNESGPVAQVAFNVKILDTQGKIVGSRSFEAETPAKGTDANSVVDAMSDTFGKVAAELIVWTTEQLNKPS